MRIVIVLLLVIISCDKKENKKEKESELKEEYSVVDSYKKPMAQWPSPKIDEGVNWEEMAPLEQNLSYYDDMEKPEVVLGKLLFFDPKLSSSNQISCSSCHHPEMGWTTHTEKAIGHNHALSKRNTPSIFNVFSKEKFFWDGRKSTLEAQALGPIEAHDEMNMDSKRLPAKLQKIKEYRKLFKDAFGSYDIDITKILKALAAFERTVKSQPSRVDKFMKGNYKALNHGEIRGLHIFRTKARCMNCHHGKYLTDQEFHNIGLTYYKRENEDLGRYNVTKRAKDVGRFLTPSLRDLLNTRPWMHNGFFDDLTGIVNVYNSGMQMINPSLEEKKKDSLYPITDSLMEPLNLTNGEIEDLVSFLKALNGTKYKMEMPSVPN